jgi:hypothetical protein
MTLLISLWALMDSVLVLMGCNVVPGQSMTVKFTLSPNQTYALPYTDMAGLCSFLEPCIFVFWVLG